MAKAYSCDRCGELFKLDDYRESVPVVLENGTPFSIDFGNGNIYITICPKCRASFQKWWDTDAVRKTTDGIHRCRIYEMPEEDNKYDNKDE